MRELSRLRRDEAGVALLAAVLAMGVLGFLGATFASLVVEHQYSAIDQGQSLRALYLAEAGFELAIQELIDNTDYAFNGAAADGVIGAITNVPLGSGTVSVTKGTQTPPVFTSTGTVGAVRRVLSMTIDLEGKKLVLQDPVFNDTVNLPTNWPQTTGGNNNGASAIAVDPANAANNALKILTDPGPALRFDAYREQVLATPLLPGSRVSAARANYMRDYTGSGAGIDRVRMNLELVRSDATTDIVWFVTPDIPPAADKGVWKLAEVKGWTTSTTLSTTKVRLSWDVRNGAIGPTDQLFAWFDNIEVNIVKKSAWGEP